MRTLGLDAGKNKVYGAIGEGTLLIALVDFDPNKECDFDAFVDHVVLEKVNINENTPNWQSTLDCGLSGERVAGRHRAPVTCYTPSQWKGSVKKPTYHLNLWHVMREEERALFHRDTYNTIRAGAEHVAKTGQVKNYAFEDHNRLDAAGILLFELERIGRGGARIR